MGVASITWHQTPHTITREAQREWVLLQSPGIKRPIRSRARLSPHTSKPPTSPCRRPKYKQHERQKQQRLKRMPQKAKTPNDAQPHPATKRRPPSPHTLAPPPPSRKGRTAAGSDRRGHRDIQLPPSREGEPAGCHPTPTRAYFNSRPRMRANTKPAFSKAARNAISTPALA